jgi:hypothetical protein
LKNRLQGSEREKIENTIRTLKKNIGSKQEIKIQILDSIKNKSKILQELENKK